jgi:uncharacterized lipoprotein YddW (UPF0748 family)
MRGRGLLLAIGLLVAACGTGGGGDGPDRAAPPTTAPTTEAPPATEPTPPPPEPTTTEAPPPPGPVVPDRVRGVWIHLFDDTLKSPAGVERVLEEAAGAGLDAVFVQVARRHDAYYRSDVLPPTPDPGLTPGFDVLQAVIDGAGPRGLAVHAWITVTPALHPQYDPERLPPDHLWRTHGPDSGDPWMTVSHGGVRSREYLDPGLLEVRAHTGAVVAEIASRYPIDGMHLDYVRYDGAEWGYHPRALERYRVETGRTGMPAPDDPTWSAWRRDQTAAIMAAARAALEEHRPQALLSVAVIAQGPGPSGSPGGFVGTRAYTLMQQDWTSWVELGLADLVIPMAYHREAVAHQRDWYRQWVDHAAELHARHEGRRAVAVGVGAWLNPLEASLEQIRLASGTTAGFVVFSYQQDTDAATARTLLRALGGG